MSRIHLFLPGNVTSHAEVMPGKRRHYVEHFGEVVAFLANAPLPLSTSFHGVDFDMTGKKVNDLPSTLLQNAAYNHILPTHFEKSPTLGEHVREMYHTGITGCPYALFNAEFDIYRLRDTPFKTVPQVMFALATGDTLLYSECGTGQVKAEGAFVSTAPLWFHDKVVVPMHGVAEAQKAFFRWQRQPTKEHADLLMMEIANLIHDDEDDDEIKVFFVDLEAPLVGSERGIVETWSAFFDLVKESYLEKRFVGLPEAAAYWRSRAVKPHTDANRLFARQTGSKWTGLHKQIDWLMKIAAGRKPHTVADHVAWSFVTTSDVLAVMNRQMRGDSVLPGTNDDIRISANPDVITVAETCFKALQPVERGMTSVKPEDLLIKLKLDHPDSTWYARRVADVIAASR
jgi:hypothetical protein